MQLDHYQGYRIRFGASLCANHGAPVGKGRALQFHPRLAAVDILVEEIGVLRLMQLQPVEAQLVDQGHLEQGNACAWHPGSDRPAPRAVPAAWQWRSYSGN